MENLHYIKQEQERGCFGAVVESITGVGQAEINEALEEEGLYYPFHGFLPAPASSLDPVLGEFGLRVANILPAPDPTKSLEDQPALADTDATVNRRAILLHSTLVDPVRSSGGIALWGVKRRDGEAPISHAVHLAHVNTGLYTVMDPSERDGGIQTFNYKNLVDYVRPDREIPVAVYAYFIDEKH